MANEISDRVVAWAVIDAANQRWKGQGIRLVDQSAFSGFGFFQLDNREGIDNNVPTIFDTDGLYYRVSVENGAVEASGYIGMSNTGENQIFSMQTANALADVDFYRIVVFSGPRGLPQNPVL